jgi:hypothetical protein
MTRDENYISNRSLIQCIRGFESQDEEDEYDEEYYDEACRAIMLQDMIWSMDPGAQIMSRRMWREESLKKLPKARVTSVAAAAA